MMAVLPDGQRTVMGSNSSIQRSSLAIKKTQYSSPLVYASDINCEYKETSKEFGSSESSVYSINLSITSVGDKSLVVMEYLGKYKSTALIDPRGKLIDFNFIDPKDGKRTTSETYQERIGEQRSSLDESLRSRAQFVNPFSLFMPEFHKISQLSVNKSVANITMEDGQNWGEYVYRGLSQYNGRSVIVLDLVRIPPTLSDSTAVLYGYNLIDAETKLPVLTVLDAGTKNVVENISCGTRE